MSILESSETLRFSVMNRKKTICYNLKLLNVSRHFIVVQIKNREVGVVLVLGSTMHAIYLSIKVVMFAAVVG